MNEWIAIGLLVGSVVAIVALAEMLGRRGARSQRIDPVKLKRTEYERTRSASFWEQ